MSTTTELTHLVAAAALTDLVRSGWGDVSTENIGRHGWHCTAHATIATSGVHGTPSTPTAARITGGGVRVNVPLGMATVTGVGSTADLAVIDAAHHAATVRTVEVAA